MTHVNPPPQVRIPDKIFKDPELRPFFEKWQRILFQLWQRTGGANDDISTIIISDVNSDTDLADNHFGLLIIIDASSAPVTITLPPISAGEIGRSIYIAVIDATNDVTVQPNDASHTILGDTDVILTQNFMAIHFVVETESSWIGL